ncbi:MAG: TerC family protein [Bacteroidetes bacterium]|nr:TerC family protein [Bacteroidota bacterium]
MEIVLGIDNIVFISILANKLPANQQARARTIGLALAMFGRLALLFSISWVMSLTETLFSLPSFGILSEEAAAISGRDIILILGGAFLIYKATTEIHDRLEGEEHNPDAGKKSLTFGAVIFQILLLDIVFSLDSVITAVGMAEHIQVMIVAVVLAVGVMMLSAGKISDFIHKHPTVKMLALAFLLLIGVTLLADGFGQHVSKGYIYAAMAFSVFVELLNLRSKKNAEPSHPVELREAGIAQTVGVSSSES